MMLAGTDDIRVVAEVADGAEVAAAVDAYKPDVVLMDIRMPRHRRPRRHRAAARPRRRART